MTTNALQPQAMQLAEVYGTEFYEGQLRESEWSAREYLPHLWSTYRPATVLDVGCGRGAWLKVAGELGAARLLGYDGPWNKANDMIESRIEFRPIDLDKPFQSEKVGLAMSLEVAEHLDPQSSAGFVKSLAGASDAVLFAAAYEGQGGTNHINERSHSFWAELFSVEGFDVFDLFRPKFWGNEKVCFWYRQNTFVYLRRGSAVHETFMATGIRPIANLAFLNCVHPQLFHRREPEVEVGLRDWLRDFGAAFGRSWSYRFGQGRGDPGV